jgi:hypothetical protein
MLDEVKIQGNIEIAKMIGWEETTEEFKIKWVGCKTEERLSRINKEHIPILQKDGDVLFPDFSVYDFSSDWKYLMDAMEYIENINPTIRTEITTSSCLIYRNTFVLVSQYMDNEGRRKVEMVFDTVVEFAKKYNKNKEFFKK